MKPCLWRFFFFLGRQKTVGPSLTKDLCCMWYSLKLPPLRQYNNLRRLFNVYVSVLNHGLRSNSRSDLEPTATCSQYFRVTRETLVVRTTYTIQQRHPDPFRPHHDNTRAWYRGITIVNRQEGNARAATNAAALPAESLSTEPNKQRAGQAVLSGNTSLCRRACKLLAVFFFCVYPAGERESCLVSRPVWLCSPHVKVTSLTSLLGVCGPVP